MGTDNDQDSPALVLTEEYDPSTDESMSSRIVRLIATASGRSPTDLTPLGRVIDPEAIDDLLDFRTIEDGSGGIELSFVYEGYRVDIEANGTMNIFVEEA